MELENWMIIGFTRYALGRMTTVVHTTTQWLVDNWSKIDEQTRTILERDIVQALNRDARGLESIGNNCDREDWGKVLYKIGNNE